MTSFDPLGIAAAADCLHVARQIIRDRAATERGSRRRKLEDAVLDAIGAVARQGLTADDAAARYR